MRKDYLEPGLLRIFALYFIARLAVYAASAAVYFLRFPFPPKPQLIPYVILFVVDIIFMFVFFLWPAFRRWLGRAYLPLALVVASAIPLVETRYLYGLYSDLPGIRLWLGFPFLLVPLILVAWQYEFRDVIAFCLGTALFELMFPPLTNGLPPQDWLMQLQMVLPRTVFFALVGYIVSNLEMVRRRQDQELTEVSRRLVRYAATQEQLTVSQERNRLARELHDTLAHTLSGLTVQLDAVTTLWATQPDRAHAMLDRALEATRSGLEETRRALRDLRASPLEDLGLAQAMRSLSHSVASRNGLALELDIADDLGDLTPELEQCYYRVSQEALENVAKHADAQQVILSLRRDEHGLTLEVADDGRGFATEYVASEYQFGLRGMRERAEMVGAELQVESKQGEGTVVRLYKGVAG